MKVRKEGMAGTDDKRDCLVRVNEGEGITITGKDQPMFGEHIETLVRQRLKNLEVEARVEVNSDGALDYVILGRLESALKKAGKEVITDHVTERSPTKTPLRRSRMYVPGNNPRMLNSAGVYGCDCLIFDLEDSVAPDAKEDARFLVKNALKHLDFGKSEVWVRVNKPTVKEDLSVVKYGNPHGICLPKAEEGEDIVILENILEEEGLEAHIMPIIETARGVENVADIAGASDSVVALAFGAEDFTRDIGGKRTWDTLLYPRSRLVVAATAHGVQALDTIYPHAQDTEGLREETQKIMEMGFHGKGAIHPSQIEVIHQCFTPTPEEIEEARAILQAVEEAKARGLGTASLHGKMIDVPVEKKARTILRRSGLLDEQ
ncbi:MAG TPA: citrate lyase ACP [Thermoplasmatales archaeon]|nr:citrate lyase ACP [Thermoplasmatales archaeon]